MKCAELRLGLPAAPYPTSPADAGEKRLTAEAILQRASDAGIYAHQSPELIALLMGVDLDKRIPQPLYLCVSGLLVWLHSVDSPRDPTPAPDAPAIAPPP